MQKQRILTNLCIVAAVFIWLVASVQAQTFTDISVQAGFLRSHTNSTWSGVWADYDNDGHLDLFTAGHHQIETFSISQLWHNDGNGHFTDVTVAAGMNPTNSDPHGCAWADFDNDGHVDLFVSHGGQKDLVHGNLHEVYRNRGNGTFTNIAMASGASGLNTTHHSRGCYAVDYNGDGRLDIYSPGYSKVPNSFVSLLFRSAGGFQFTETAAAAGVIRRGQTNRVAPWSDFDGDGLPDVLVVSPNAYDGKFLVLFKNQGDGTFIDVTAGSGLPTSPQCENAVWGDYDNDGDSDLYLCQQAGLRGFLCRNDGNGHFTDVTTASGLINSVYAEGLTWGDYDNDGDLDLYIVNVKHAQGPNRLFRNNGDGTFTDVTASTGVGAQVPGNGADGVFVDYDGDGFLDLFITNGWSNERGPYVLLKNGGNANHWLKITLVGTQSNRDAIMTKVRVFTGPTMQFREYTGPQHFMSQNRQPLHFGLASATMVDRIELIWPSGLTQQVLNVSADQPITIVESNDQADLQINKTASSNIVETGSIVTYTLNIANNGPQPASKVVVTDNLPAGMAFASCTPSGAGVCGGVGNTRTITFASLGTNQVETILLSAVVDCSLADGIAVTNTATVTASTLDLFPGSNTSTNIVTVSSPSPVAVCSNTTAVLDGSGQVTISPQAVDAGSTDNCGITSSSVAPSSFTCADLGDTMVTLTVRDAGNNLSTCQATVTVLAAPLPITCAADRTIPADATCQAAIPDLTSEIVASDSCPVSGLLTITQDPLAGTIVGPGESLVTISVADEQGNRTHCTATVTVVEPTAPTIITCAAGKIISANAGCQAAIPDLTGEIVASDDCTPAGSLLISQSPPAATLVGLGETLVTLTVMDGSGNRSNCTAQVTVVDTTAPPIICPANVVTNVPSSSAIVNYTTPTGTDNCSIPSILCLPSSGTSFPLGTNNVTCTATDSANNSNSCMFKVIVRQQASNKPHVTITAPDATASEPGSNTGKFKVTRTGSTGSALIVNYAVSGTATAGSDYQTLPRVVTIPAGSGSKTFLLNPKNDSKKEPSETVKVTLSPNAAYNISSPNNATVNIRDND